MVKPTLLSFFYKEGFTYDVAANDQPFNVELITDVDKEHYFDLYLSRIH